MKITQRSTLPGMPTPTATRPSPTPWEREVLHRVDPI